MNWRKLKNKLLTWFSDSSASQVDLFIFTAPSGAGKTTIVKHLLKTFDELDFSVSATTRKGRADEKDGIDYYFKSVKEFKQLIADDAFVEWEEVYADQFYGTLKSEIDRLLDKGKKVVFDIDVQGALDIKKVYGDRALAIFVEPPSKEILFERLRGRNTESPESLKKRINKATRELTFSERFDMKLLNDKLDGALADAERIIRKHL